MKQWYTLHTKPNAEYQVVAVLQQRGVQTYLPEIEFPKTRKRQKKRKPFFPCYCFFKLDFEVAGLSNLQWTPGLRRIVAFDGQPAPLANELVDLIRHQLGELEASGQPTHSFKPGDTVRITGGPFRDMLAIFNGPTTPSKRVQV